MKHKKQLFMILLIAFLLVGLGTLEATDVTKNDTSVTKTTDVTKTSTLNKDVASTSKVQATTKSDDNKKIIETKTNTKTNKIITDKTIKKTDITKNVKTAGSYTENVTNYTGLVTAIENAKRSTSDEYTINLTPGDYTATQEITWENSQNTKTIIIEGNNNTLNGNNSNIRFITIAEGHNLILNNITIQNYTYTSHIHFVRYYGGAIQNNGKLTITNSIIKNNHINLTGFDSSSYGGAINNNGTLTIKDSNLNYNNATWGGAIYNANWSTLNIHNTNLTGNTATSGGAITNANWGTLNIHNTTLTGNNATWGGAIQNNGNLNIHNTNLTGNTATSGGAIENYQGTININNTNLTGNNATSGGAITNGGTLNINNTNLNNNNATQNGGAIYNTRSTLNITHSNLTGNNATDGGAMYNDVANIILTGNNITHNTAAANGGAIFNIDTNTNISIINSKLTHNNATRGGAINNYGNLNITSSNLTHNNANQSGGAISTSNNRPIILFNSNFTENNAVNGAVIHNYWGKGNYNITYNTFKRNNATGDKETLNLGNDFTGTIAENTYDNTDINLTTINLTTQETIYQYNDDIILNYTIQLTNKEYYDADILDKINKTLYIDNVENSTTKEKNYTLSKLKAGLHTIYYKTCNYESNNLTLTVTGDSEIKTDKTTYDHVDGIKNKITLDITDPSGEKGTITITVKDQDEYKKLSSYSNVGNEYPLSTDALVEALENLYTDLGESYTINISYTSDNEYVNTSSTEFTLNIIKKRNTTIEYEIINSTEGNVQINVTVLDAIYKTPIPDAQIQITGALENETTTGIITDNTLKPGNYNITINYNGTEEYNKSNTTIDFTVEIDKDAKITELENNITNLTQDLKDAQEEIQNLTETNKEYKELIEAALKTLEDLNKTLNNLTQQLENYQQEIQELNQTITELNKTLDTTINIKPVTSSVGSHVNLTATITDTAGNKVTTGKVLFKVNGLTLKDESGNVIYAIVNNGEATLTTKTQAAWIKNNTNIQAVYSGEKPYKSSRANTTNITITKGKATITLDKPNITAKAGQSITLKAKVLDSNGDRVNNDKVVFKLNGRTLTDKDGKTLYARVVDGEAVLEYTIPETYNAKTYNLTAVFGGNYFERTQTQGTIILEKKATTITPENITTTNGKTMIKAQIHDETGKTLTSTTKVVIKINGKTINTTNSTNGTIDTSFTTTLKPGTYELTIISGENGQYKKATLTTALKI